MRLQALPSCVLLTLAACGLQSCQLSGASFETAGFRYTIDPSILVGADKNASLVEVVRDPKGRTSRFAANIVDYEPSSQNELRDFLEKYGGTVIRDGSQSRPTKRGKPVPPSGIYIVHVDVSRSPLDDFPKSMQAANLHGHYVFGSLSAARLVALVARENLAKLSIGLDPSFYGGEVWNIAHVDEGTLPPPTPPGTVFDYEAEPYATTTLNLNPSAGKPGGLGIGVVRAWDYMEYKGIPFGSTWQVPYIAFIDGGFALDTHTGAPLDGNIDFHGGATPIQISETIDGGQGTNAGGTSPSPCSGGDSCPWHGTEVFSVAAAQPFNSFGSAGTGGLIPEAIFVRVDSTFGYEVTQGIVDAVLLEPPADVINLSVYDGGVAGLGVFYALALKNMQRAVNFANGYNNAIVISIAGNEGETNEDTYDNPPCTLDQVICVGAIDNSAKLEQLDSGTSGYGPRVSIFAPDGIVTTPNPGTNGEIRRAYGTSASAPFVAGIVSLMKALNPGLTFSDVRQILQSTALPSPDPKVKPGYVNALAAVMAVSPNIPPTVKITSPTNHAELPYGTYITFNSTVIDPEQGPNVVQAGLTITWTSDINGLICMAQTCDSSILSPGLHTITERVTDPFGASTQDSISLLIDKPTPPVPYIIAPANGSAFFSSQKIHLIGSASAPNEPVIPDSRLQWSSSLAGGLGLGSNLLKALPVGSQTLTLTATDSFGNTGSTSVNITVQVGADYPTVSILNPPPPIYGVGLNQPIYFWGSGSDPVDGALSGSQLTWVSDIDGPLGTGTMISKTLSGFLCGPTMHHITLTGTNSHGYKSSATEIIYVGPIC
jgi:hypothetical protein